MLRNLLLSSLLSLGLAATAAESASGNPPQTGMWQDGTKLMWQCDVGMEGKVRIMVITPSGTTYPAEVECLPKGQKKT